MNFWETASLLIKTSVPESVYSSINEHTVDKPSILLFYSQMLLPKDLLLLLLLLLLLDDGAYIALQKKAKSSHKGYFPVAFKSCTFEFQNKAPAPVNVEGFSCKYNLGLYFEGGGPFSPYTVI